MAKDKSYLEAKYPRETICANPNRPGPILIYMLLTLERIESLLIKALDPIEDE